MAAVAREMGRRIAGGRCWAGWAERPTRRRLLEQGRRGELGQRQEGPGGKKGRRAGLGLVLGRGEKKRGASGPNVRKGRRWKEISFFFL